MSMMPSLRRLSASCSLFIFLTLPASTNYEFHDLGLGAGGADVVESSNYGLSGIAGEASAPQLSGTNFDLGPGLQFTRQSNVPPAPSFTNPASHYNKLRFTLDNTANPSDTLYAIAISDDDFLTTRYIQADNTIGSSPVYQTYTAWGGASGAFVIGLNSSTSYKIKVRAVQTKYTESAFSATATAATSAPNVTFDLDIGPTDTESAPPYTVAFGQLALAAVTTATDRIWLDFTTNAEQGGFVYVYNNSGGLTSALAGYTITSASTDLSTAGEGFGAQVTSTSQTSGGPLTAVSPYNGSGENVGILDTTTRTIFNTSNANLLGGRAAVWLKAKASTTTPSASDYSSVITMIASATF